MFIIGGIVGSILIPALSDRLKRRKPVLIVCVLAGLLLVFPLCRVTDLALGLMLGGIVGFFFLPAYALMLTMSEEIAGRSKAGMATGILMMVGNAGGVLVIVAMALVKGESDDWTNSIILMEGLLVTGFVLCWFVRETYHSASTEKTGDLPS